MLKAKSKIKTLKKIKKNINNSFESEKRQNTVKGLISTNSKIRNTLHYCKYYRLNSTYTIANCFTLKKESKGNDSKKFKS